ncbi:MAG: hypothetical protein QMD92_00210 [bacterium]|nr:hypothetical protein [bacterium]
MDTRFNHEGRRYQIQRLWNIHYEIMRLALIGRKAADIARELGVTEVMVSYTLNSELAKRRMEIMRGVRDAEALDLSIEIKRFAPEAFKLLKKVLRESDSEKNKIVVALDVLDRAGYAPPKVIEGRFMHAHFTAEEIEEMKKRSKDSGQVVVEGELVESNSI